MKKQKIFMIGRQIWTTDIDTWYPNIMLDNTTITLAKISGVGLTKTLYDDFSPQTRTQAIAYMTDRMDKAEAYVLLNRNYFYGSITKGSSILGRTLFEIDISLYNSSGKKRDKLREDYFAQYKCLIYSMRWAKKEENQAVEEFETWINDYQNRLNRYSKDFKQEMA